MTSSITGTLSIAPSKTIAERLPMFAAVYFWNRAAASAVRLKVVTGRSVESTAVRASRKSVPRMTGWLRSTYHMRSPLCEGFVASNLSL